MDTLLPDRMDSNIRLVMETVRIDDWDWLMTVDGRERVGKTAFSLLSLLTASTKLYRDVLCAIYDRVLSRFSWDFDSMVDTIISLPRGEALCYQEASMLGREALRSWNLRMVRVMTTVGTRNVFFILTFPRYGMLDPYLRYRTRTRVYCRTHHGVRGYARCYYRAYAETDNDDGLRYAYDTTFRNPANDRLLSELWALLREKEDAVKMKILTAHGRRADTTDEGQ